MTKEQQIVRAFNNELNKAFKPIDMLKNKVDELELRLSNLDAYFEDLQAVMSGKTPPNFIYKGKK